MSEQQLKRLSEIRERDGFDASYKLESGAIRIACSQCEALVINGVACHETGCPNAKRGDDQEEED